MKIFTENNKLIISQGLSSVVIECWGPNSIRVRMTPVPEMDSNDWALTI